MITEDYSSQGLHIESMNQEIYIPEGFEATIKGNRIILKKTISEDEKIRKDIIAFIKKRDRSGCDYDYDKWIDLLEKQGEQKPVDKVEPFDKNEGLTDFERTLADICIGWIGEELGWKQYIKDNADVLLKIAIKKFNSIQDAPFKQKSAAWSDEDEHRVEDTIYFLDTAKKHYACTIELDACIDWLKSLKDRIGG